MKKINTKRALFTSVMSMLLCVTMLIGSTFAWFTDNATTSVNTIVSGTLDVALVDGAGKSLEGTTLGFVKGGTNTLWEPGSSWTLQDVYVKNNGNLALKFKITITGIKGNAELNNVIDWSIQLGTETLSLTNGVSQEFHLGAGETSDKLNIVGKMQETAGNEYQGKTIEGISILVQATQDTVEHDSFNNSYDASAKYSDGHTGDVTVAPGTAQDLHDVLETALAGGSTEGVITINLEKDFDVNNAWTTATGSGYSGVNTVVINGNGHSITNLNQPLMEGVFGGAGSLEIKDLTIKDSTISAAGGSGVGIGVFMNNADAANYVSFTNCKIDNVKITNTADDSTLGGFIGYSSAGTLVFNNCSVTNSTLTGTKDIGAFVGYTQSAVTATNVVVTGNTITSSNTSTYRVGAIAGTFNSKPSTVTISNVSGNTITQANAADMSKHTTDYAGRVYAEVTVNGEPLAKNN